MVKLIKLDPSSESYIYSKSKNTKVLMLDYNNNDLVLHINDNGVIIECEMDKVYKQYSGMYYIANGNDKILIDDGYYDTLCRAGYIVLGDYDKITLTKEDGPEVMKKIQDDISEGIIRMVDNGLPEGIYLNESTDTSIIVESEYYTYSLYADPILTIVTENQKRKLNDLPFYPYTKEIDKYGSLYIRAYVKLRSNCNEKDILDKGISKYTEVDDLIKNLIVSVNGLDGKNDYHYEPLTIKKMIIK